MFTEKRLHDLNCLAKQLRAEAQRAASEASASANIDLADACYKLAHDLLFIVFDTQHAINHL